MHPVRPALMNPMHHQTSGCSSTTKKIAVFGAGALIAGIGISFNSPFTFVTGLLLGIGGLAVNFATSSVKQAAISQGRTLRSDLESMQAKRYISPQICAYLLAESAKKNPTSFLLAIQSFVQSHQINETTGFFILRCFDADNKQSTPFTDWLRDAQKAGHVNNVAAYHILLAYRQCAPVQFFGAIHNLQQQGLITADSEKHIQKNYAKARPQRIDLMQVYQETCRAIAQGRYITPTGRTVHLDAALQANLERSATVYPSIRPAPYHQPRFQTQITVENLTTLRMTEKLLHEGLNPLVLDMANRYSAGGGVRTGANAQEEIICRESNLMKALLKIEQQDRYPLPELGGIYAPGVQFFRADPSEGYAFLERPLTASVFASAFYDCNTAHSGFDRPIDDRDYIANTKDKIRTMLRAALIHGHDSLVLSAGGCGAFKNDPQLIASLYQEVFAEPEFKGQFRKIAFGIIDDHNGSNNFSTFKRAFHSA